MNEPLPWLDRLAHDLRGPLMPLQTAAYLLRSGQLEPLRQQELFELVDRQTRRLARMIDELSDWSRAAQNNLLGAREPCEPTLLLDNAIGGVNFAGQSNPEVVDETGKVHIDGDPVRLTQLLRTLLEYAVHKQASHQQPARICMRIHANRAQIDVVDASAAVDAAQLAMLLQEPMPEPFDEGLGLRLLIARAIAEAHGGSLVAEPTVEGGLRLHCELPIAMGDQP